MKNFAPLVAEELSAPRQVIEPAGQPLLMVNISLKLVGWSSIIDGHDQYPSIIIHALIDHEQIVLPFLITHW